MKILLLKFLFQIVENWKKYYKIYISNYWKLKSGFLKFFYG